MFLGLKGGKKRKIHFGPIEVKVISVARLLGLSPAEGQPGGKGDEAFYQIWTPLPTVKQWDPDRSTDT